MKVTAINKKKKHKHTVFPVDKLVIEDNHGNIFTIVEGEKGGLKLDKINNVKLRNMKAVGGD